jgi:MoaA/NifB/PqqE/SkfB family radical SAM enzyme
MAIAVSETVKKIGNVDFEITYNCNLNCLHCYNPKTLRSDELSTSQILKVIDEIKEAGFKEIHITGGEPCLHKDIISILKYADKLGLNILLETNATILPNVSDLKDIKNLTIRASIEGYAKIHNVVRKSNLDDAYMQSINNLVKAQNSGITVQTTTSVNQINYKFIKDMVRDLVNHKLTNIRLRLSMPAGNALKNWNDIKLTNEQYTIVRKQMNLSGLKA